MWDLFEIYDADTYDYYYQAGNCSRINLVFLNRIILLRYTKCIWLYITL